MGKIRKHDCSEGKFYFLCFRFRVYLLDVYYLVIQTRPTGWTHIVLNYIGPNDGQGIRIFYDGQEVTSEIRKSASSSSRPAGDGRIVVGRIYTDQDKLYASMQIDELAFFNEALSSTEITAMYSTVQPTCNSVD